MNAQEIFNTVKNHLLTQKKRSILSQEQINVMRQSKGHQIFNSCAYRGIDNTKCAFGILIPDDVYSEEMEGKTAWIMITDFPVLRQKYGEYTGLITVLQNIHDNWESDGWEDKLREMAKEFNLSYE